MSVIKCGIFVYCILITKTYYVNSEDKFEVDNKFHHPYNILKIRDSLNKLNNHIVLRNVIQQNLNSESFDPLKIVSNYESESPFEYNFDFGNSSSKCLHDILYMIENLISPWALKMIDSFGKPESGLLEGNAKWIGDYDECVGVHAPPKNNSRIGDFDGKYCSLQISIKLGNFSMPLQFGLCVPDTCSSFELMNDFHKLMNLTRFLPFLNFDNSTVKVKSLNCKTSKDHLNAPTIGVICLISFFGFLALIGSSFTVYEYFFSGKEDKLKIPSYTAGEHGTYGPINHETEKSSNHITDTDDELLFVTKSTSSEFTIILQKCKPFFKCFCIFTNGSKLLNTDSVEGQLLCIHGIRFLSMTWVILGHTYAFCFTVIRNILEAPSFVDNFAFQVVLQGFFSVDSFFVLSGFLLTFLFMNEITKSKGKVSFLYFYLHRYIRLTPVYMIVLGFSSTVFLYMGSGPNWPDNEVDEGCKKYWWYNLLYINNFLSSKQQCMGWAWYLANDMQFYVISPIFLITLWRWPKIGFSLLATFFAGTWLANFFITYHFNLTVGPIVLTGQQLQSMEEIMDEYLEYFDKIYVKPYTRIGPYLVGMLVGYILFKAKMSNRPKFNQITLLIGWAAATAVTMTCVYGLYRRTPDLLAISFYNAFSRICFAGGLSWVMYVCLTGQGGPVDKILSYKLFIPLSRLTYCAYLIHPLIITGYFTSLTRPLQFSHPTMVVLFLGFLVVTYGLSLLVSLIFESPIIGLEKLIRNKFKQS